MHFVRISPTQLINLELITRIEIQSQGDVRYTTLHFTGEGSYRCTEEESEVLLPLLKEHIKK